MVPPTEPRTQSAALPYRIDPKGRLRILLVKTRSGRWGIPKGHAEPGLSLSENAAKEAWEEAGVTGIIAPESSGKYRAIKQSTSGAYEIEVTVYLLQVTRQSAEWPEKATRRTQWFDGAEAASLVGEPMLKRLCSELVNTTARVSKVG